MTILLHLLIIIPLAGFILSLWIPGKREQFISSVALLTVSLHFMTLILFQVLWFRSGFFTVDVKDLVIFETKDYEFFLDFLYDKITATYLFVGCILALLIVVYSRYYLHREEGYKRFFNNTLFFYFGYNMVVLSGNLETLFIGWEILGISSFLLIAFYRERYLPVKNAVKVFSIYRIGDVGLILTLWMSHHLWHANVTFDKMNNYELVHNQLQNHTMIGVFISLMILLSAAAKSAQLPFSSWLPRAMEGPTPSTAIFYGSLSVHIGVFLLLRTYPFWEHQLSVRILIGIVGLLTSMVTSGIARVQSSVKSQIAYASISQIGLIFVEVAAGWTTLALIHFSGNAFLRTYQLLVSPSVVTYLIREQFYRFVPGKNTFEDTLPKKLEYSLYVLCLKEWNLDSLMYSYLWNPLKWVGRKLDFLIRPGMPPLGIIAYLGGWVVWYYEEVIPLAIREYIPVLFSFIGLVLVLKSFTERKNVKMSWILILMNPLWIALAISFNDHFQPEQTFLYLSGIILFGITGFICLRILRILEKDIDLDRFHGHAHLYPGLAFIFLLSCLGVAGFPITPTFIGEDLIFTHIHEDQPLLASIVALSFIIDGLAIIRIYARLFLGPHVRSIFEMGYRSS